MNSGWIYNINQSKLNFIDNCRRRITFSEFHCFHPKFPQNRKFWDYAKKNCEQWLDPQNKSIWIEIHWQLKKKKHFRRISLFSPQKVHIFTKIENFKILRRRIVKSGWFYKINKSELNSSENWRRRSIFGEFHHFHYKMSIIFPKIQNFEIPRRRIVKSG